MLKLRVIPTLLIKNNGLVKGVGFDSSRRVGSILPAINVYTARGADELIVLDITATDEKRPPDFEAVEGFTSRCFIPLTVGGGITSLNDIERLLEAGADKISLNTAAYTNPDLITEAAHEFGSQCIVVSIDTKGTCFSHSGKVDTGLDPAEWAREVEDRGAGEILLTSIERDGTMQGYDLETISKVREAVKVQVIASGGAGNPEHMLEAIKAGASAVAASSMFHFTDQNFAGVKAALNEAGIPVRLKE